MWLISLRSEILRSKLRSIIVCVNIAYLKIAFAFEQKVRVRGTKFCSAVLTDCARARAHREGVLDLESNREREREREKERFYDSHNNAESVAIVTQAPRVRSNVSE